MINIALIGAGNLGSRHLQGLASLDREVTLQVIEPSENAREVARCRWEEVNKNTLIQNVIFLSDIEQIKRDTTLVIVATSAGPRKSIIKYLLENVQVKYMILEKVVFQCVGDFYEIKTLLDERGIRVWINCARRLLGFYQDLRIRLCSQSSKVNMIVNGSNWGLGCNSIHMLDLYAFLTGAKEFKVDNSLLDSGCIDSKRQGYKEFTGQLNIVSEKGTLLLTSHCVEAVPFTIYLSSNIGSYLLEEGRNTAHILSQGTNPVWVDDAMDIKYQSQMTNLVVQEILDTEECGLTCYDDTIKLHEVLLNAFLEHLNRTTERNVELCPIT